MDASWVVRSCSWFSCLMLFPLKVTTAACVVQRNRSNKTGKPCPLFSLIRGAETNILQYSNFAQLCNIACYITLYIAPYWAIKIVTLDTSEVNPLSVCLIRGDERWSFDNELRAVFKSRKANKSCQILTKLYFLAVDFNFLGWQELLIAWTTL